MNSSGKQDAWIGRLLGEKQRYRIEKRIDAGGMGDIFLAMDTLLGQQVALKLLKETLGTQELRKRFEREVRISAALKSDHIVEVSDYGVTAQNHAFYVMEYLRGQTLRQLLRQVKRLSAERTVGIISQVCDGLQTAHEGVTLWRDGATASEQVRVVHRDLKPDNIFLVPTALGELVKILDFGIAKISHNTGEHTNLTQTFIGTFQYSSPEQLAATKDIDGRADIYSLGVTLYEMLSGTDPFGLGLNKNKITSQVSWAIAHNSKQPQPITSQPGCENLSPKLDAVVMRCLQKSPEQRFATVSELKRALQAALGSGSRTSGRTKPQLLTPYEQDEDATVLHTPVPPEPAGAPDVTVLHTPVPPEPAGAPDVTVLHTPVPPEPAGAPDVTVLHTPVPPEPAGSLDVTVLHTPVPPEPAGSPKRTSVQTSIQPGQGALDQMVVPPVKRSEHGLNINSAQNPHPPGQGSSIQSSNSLPLNIDGRPSIIPSNFPPFRQSPLAIVGSGIVIALALGWGIYNWPQLSEQLIVSEQKPNVRELEFSLAKTLAGHSNSVGSVAISSDGQTLASGSEDKTIKIWRLSDGQLLRTISEGAAKIRFVAISPDRQTLVSGWDNNISLWNLDTGKLLRTLAGHSNSVESVAISSDGQTLASGSEDKTIKIWRLETGQLLRTLSGHADAVLAVAISPDGQTLVSGSKDKTIKIWHLETGQLLRTISGHADAVLAVAISPDGQTLVSTSEDNIKIWNLNDGKLLRTLSGLQDRVVAIAITPDGQSLVSSSEDKTIKVWRLSTGELLNTIFGHLDSVGSIAISPDGQTLVSGSKDKTIKIWRR